MTRVCAECGEPVWTISRTRRIALWLRVKLERLAFLLDLWTAPRFRPGMGPHIHLTDEEWAALDELRS